MKEKYLDIKELKSATEGSITVFLSLILILILSLLLTMIEGARINTAKIYTERALSTGMDSVLAEYYAPLWKEYHLFGLDTGYGNKEANEDEMLSKLEDYMSYTFQPNKEMDVSSGKNGMELYGISVKKLTLDNSTRLMDYQGKLFVNEAVEYMKYEDLSDAAELLMNKLSLLESPKKVSYLYEEKQKVSEELVEIDEGILDLMELLDGVDTSKKGISVTKDHLLKTVPYFVKKICIGDITKEKTGINQESVFLALKENYIDPVTILNQIDNNFTKIDELLKDIEAAQQNYNQIVTCIEAASRALAGLSGSKSKDVEKTAQQLSSYINTLSAQLSAIQKQIAQDEKEKDQCIENIIAAKNRLSELTNHIKPKIEEAISVIDNILTKTGNASQLIKGYEEKLNKEKEGLDTDLYTNLDDELKEMKRYTSEDEDGYHFLEMKEILINDLSILNQAEDKLELGEQYLQQGNYSVSRGYFKEAINIFKTYQIDGLRIDYSTLVLTKDEDLNPINKVSSCTQSGLVGLVMDPDTISKSELTTGALPSEINALETGVEAQFDFSSFFDQYKVGNKDTGVSSFFGTAGEETNVMSILGEEINKLTENYLLQEYLSKHFMMYPMEGEDLKIRKPSALTYEQEYLLLGNSTDKENLSSVIARIVLIRSILDFVSLLKDKAKYTEAKAAAAVMVGFTGLPILISITQMVILLIWAFAEALVDTSAIMMGKEVEILKKSTVLNFTDLFLLNRAFIQKKATQMVNASQSNKTKVLTLSYKDYLRIFLLFKKKETLAYRSMDLIQENLRLRYDDNFTFQNCLFGFKVSSDFIIPSKFITFPFVEKYTGKVKGYRYHTQAAYSY